jgi:hypothetical protein
MHFAYVAPRTAMHGADFHSVHDTMFIRRKEAAARSAKEMEQAKLEAETALKAEAERLRKGVLTPLQQHRFDRHEDICLAPSQFRLCLRTDQMSCPFNSIRDNRPQEGGERTRPAEPTRAHEDEGSS